jgi:hypothetical protein
MGPLSCELSAKSGSPPNCTVQAVGFLALADNKSIAVLPFPLWDDPAFQVIVNDPANNAPLPFNLQDRTSTGK